MIGLWCNNVISFIDKNPLWLIPLYDQEHMEIRLLY
jgi:hypothetical protein